MEELKKAFVIMPFKEPYNSYYAAIYKPALEAASCIVSRVDDLSAPRPIILDIQESILNADLILCDMSERNPNVFYELGLAHAIGKPAILVARKEDDIPFDLRHVRVVLFDHSLPGWEKKLERDITSAAQKVHQTRNVWPPPLVEDEHTKLMQKYELEKIAALQDAEIKRIKAESAVTQQNIIQKVELQKIELEKARADFQYRQERLMRAMDAISQALSSQSTSRDPEVVEIIRELLQSLGMEDVQK
jgi:hypothetical protein